MDQEHTNMTFNLILNLSRDYMYLTVCYNYSKKQLSNRWIFQSLIKDVIMSKDTLLKNNNKLSNKFVTNLEYYKSLKTKSDLEKHVRKKQLGL